MSTFWREYQSPEVPTIPEKTNKNCKTVDYPLQGNFKFIVGISWFEFDPGNPSNAFVFRRYIFQPSNIK